MTYDGSDRRDIRRAEKAAKVAQHEDDIVTAQIMASASGRAWMFRKLALCGMQSDGYSDIPSRMAFMSGQKNIGIQLQADIERSCPDQYIAMMREANVRDSADDARSSRNQSNGDGGDSSAEAGGDDTGTGFGDEARDET